MAAPSNHTFIQQINEHLGIAHKVCRLYFDDPQDREDILQEMMYQLWKSHDDFEGRSKFSTWMYSVCLHTALTYRRRNKKERREPLAESHHQIAEAPASSEEDTINLLFEVIAMLQPLNRAIVLLYLEHMSYEEISAITGLSKTNVSVRLVRIKKELEKELKKKLKPIQDVHL